MNFIMKLYYCQLFKIFNIFFIYFFVSIFKSKSMIINPDEI